HGPPWLDRRGRRKGRRAWRRPPRRGSTSASGDSVTKKTAEQGRPRDDYPCTPVNDHPVATGEMPGHEAVAPVPWSPAMNRSDIRRESPFDDVLRYAVAVGATLVLLVPAARGESAVGWLPLWLVGMPLCAWACLRWARPRDAGPSGAGPVRLGGADPPGTAAGARPRSPAVPRPPAGRPAARRRRIPAARRRAARAA